MARTASKSRKTKETDIDIALSLEGDKEPDISTGIPFFDHMMTLFSVHGFFGLKIKAKGDIDVDFHHTVEDVGIVLGEVFDAALADRKGIRRYGFAVTPMDDALAQVSVDMSKRPFLVYNVPVLTGTGSGFNLSLAKEFFRAFSTAAGMNLHINVLYGDNEHHVIESIFKSLGRALDQACSLDKRVKNVRSTKGVI